MKSKILISLLSGVFLFSSAVAWAQMMKRPGQALSLLQRREEMTNPAGAGKETPGKKEEGGTSFRSGSEGFVGLDYQIHLLGQLQSPGTYRLPPSTRLDEAISKASGVVERGSQRRVEIRRDGRVHRYDLYKFQRFGDLSQNPFLLDNDVVFVPYIESSVAIRGPVKSNGVFELLAHEKTLWDLIQLVGGFTVGVSERNPVTVVRFEGSDKKLLKVANVQQEMEEFELLNGDIVVIPHVMAENRHFDYNITDLPADNVYLPTQKSEVYVTGAVQQPGPYPYISGNSVRDFVHGAGPLETARLQSAYVLTADGKFVRNPEKKNFRLSPGDTVVVPRRHVTTDNALKWYGTITSTIFSGFALKSLLQ